MSVQTLCPDATLMAKYKTETNPGCGSVGLEQHLARCRPCLDRLVRLGQRPTLPEIPGYHLVDEIGRGRFGVVYKGWRMVDAPALVAVKVLTAPGEMERSRFEREIAVLKKISSPSIVKCLDAGETASACYYVMEHVVGVHLDEYFEGLEDDVRAKLKVFERVCRAVGDAHAMGVVHRDLKPRNILIDAEGHPHVLDFGICGIEDSSWSSWDRCTITHPGDVIGTLRYMSPEQAWGGVSGTIDQRSDVWALGIILFELATNGEYPYSLDPARDKPLHEALLERIRKELPKIPRFDSLPRGRDIEVLIGRCLTWEPERRIASAVTIADDLNRYLHGEPTHTKPLWFPHRLKRILVGAATRARWMFTVSLITTAGLILYAAAYLLNIGWYVRVADAAGAGAYPTQLAGSFDGLAGIRIIGISDNTINAVVAYAEENQIEGVTSDLKSWRGLHGSLMERLCMTRPKAMVWDYYFQSEQQGDEAFARGARALQAVGSPVVLAVLTYNQQARPGLSPGITEPMAGSLHHGVITARDTIKRPGEFVMAIKRSTSQGDKVIPSVALSTLAAMLHPTTELDLDWTGRERTLEMLYEFDRGAFLRERGRIELSRVITEPGVTASTEPGDLLGFMKLPLHEPDVWRSKVIPYETLLGAGDEELYGLTANKLLIVGDLRRARFGFADDHHNVKYGHSIQSGVPGCFLLADSIVGMVEGVYIQLAFPLPPRTFLAVLAVAAVGCAIPIGAARRLPLYQPRARAFLWLGLSVLSIGCLFTAMASRQSVPIHLGLLGFALLMPMTGSFWVELTRNRHRIAGKKLGAAQRLSQSSAGTITLAPRRATSHSETRSVL